LKLRNLKSHKKKLQVFQDAYIRMSCEVKSESPRHQSSFRIILDHVRNHELHARPKTRRRQQHGTARWPTEDYYRDKHDPKRWSKPDQNENGAPTSLSHISSCHSSLHHNSSHLTWNLVSNVNPECTAGREGELQLWAFIVMANPCRLTCG